MLYFDDSGHLEHAQKFTGNPLLSAPPSPWEVTGWRDPFVFRDVHLDALVKGAVFGEEERGDDDGDGNARVHEERFRGTAFVREVEYNYMLLGGGVRHYGGVTGFIVCAPHCVRVSS